MNYTLNDRSPLSPVMDPNKCEKVSLTLDRYAEEYFVRAATITPYTPKTPIYVVDKGKLEGMGFSRGIGALTPFSISNVCLVSDKNGQECNTTINLNVKGLNQNDAKIGSITTSRKTTTGMDQITRTPSKNNRSTTVEFYKCG